jgi:hypothetical protein
MRVRIATDANHKGAARCSCAPERRRTPVGHRPAGEVVTVILPYGCTCSTGSLAWPLTVREGSGTAGL